MSKKSDNREMLPGRIGLGIILFIMLLFMFVINPNENADKFGSDNLWEAVHPWNAILDTVALIGLIAFALLLAGYLGKLIGSFKTITAEGAKVIGIIGMLLTVLFFL